MKTYIHGQAGPSILRYLLKEKAICLRDNKDLSEDTYSKTDMSQSQSVKLRIKNTSSTQYKIPNIDVIFNKLDRLRLVLQGGKRSVPK